MWVSGRVAFRSGSTIRQCLLQLRYRVVWAGRRSAHFERTGRLFLLSLDIRNRKQSRSNRGASCLPVWSRLDPAKVATDPNFAPEKKVWLPADS